MQSQSSMTREPFYYYPRECAQQVYTLSAHELAHVLNDAMEWLTEGLRDGDAPLPATMAAIDQAFHIAKHYGMPAPPAPLSARPGPVPPNFAQVTDIPDAPGIEPRRIRSYYERWAETNLPGGAV